MEGEFLEAGREGGCRFAREGRAGRGRTKFVVDWAGAGWGVCCGQWAWNTSFLGRFYEEGDGLPREGGLRLGGGG